MWPTPRHQSGIELALLALVVAILSFQIVSPGSAAARAAHSGTRRAAPKATRVAAAQPLTASVPNSDLGVLIRIQDRQRFLQAQADDLKKAVQQLRDEIKNSKQEAQQRLEQNEQRNESTRRLLKIIVALFGLLCGGLVYLVRPRRKPSVKAVARKRDNAPPEFDIAQPEFEDDGIVSWPKVRLGDGGKALNLNARAK